MFEIFFLQCPVVAIGHCSRRHQEGGTLCMAAFVLHTFAISVSTPLPAKCLVFSLRQLMSLRTIIWYELGCQIYVLLLPRVCC